MFWAGFIIVLGLIVWGMNAAMEKQNNRGLESTVGTPSPVSSTDHVYGPVDAKVTIIEYSDFQCPACEAYYPVVEHVLASSTVPVRLVYRHFPLPQHANANIASRASEAAGLQGKFWEMYKLLFSRHVEWTELKDPTAVFSGYAKEIGLNVEKFKTDMESDVVKAAVTAYASEAIKVGIDRTPTFFLNGKIINNPEGYEPFIKAIEAAAR